MAKLTVWGLSFIIILSDAIINTQLFIHGNSHANNEVHYIVDELPIRDKLTGENSVRISNYEEDAVTSSPHLRLSPRILDFKDRPLGVPHHEKVIVHNTNANKTIHLNSISGNTVHFHSSFFQDKVIPPLGNTSFNVVFLGREEGAIESHLFIHTSEGSIKYTIRGNSVSSPYRIRPLVGVHMPINASFAPLIHMHNPHPNPIQILEIYSSGGELSLELPSGELEATKKLWEIPPFETKAVIRARLLAVSHKNHTCYVRIRLNGINEHLIVPLEVEVGATTGLYTPTPSLDLGILGSESPPTRLSLLLYNSGRKSTLIQNVYTVPASEAVKITFNTIKVPPDTKIATEVAIITFDPKKAFEEKHFAGRIIVKGKNKLVIPYHAKVLQGGLHFNSTSANYCTDEFNIDTLKARNFSVRNTFLFPLVISNVSLPPEAIPYFQILKFKPVTLFPGKEIVLFELKPNVSSIEQGLHLESYVEVVTNVSSHTIPLLCYDGHVIKVISPQERGEDGDNEALELGLIGVGGYRQVEFAIVNPNPVNIEFPKWGVESDLGGGDKFVMEFIGIKSGLVDEALQHWASPPTVNLTHSSFLAPHHFAVFRVNANIGVEEGYKTIEMFIQTEFQKVIIPIKVHVAKGNIKLEPEIILFDDSFPGKVSTQVLNVHSTFQHSMRVLSLKNQKEPDERLSFNKVVDVSIRPFGTTKLGELQFDPRLVCKDHCYVGIDFTSSAGMQWLHGLMLNDNYVWEYDTALLTTMYMWFLGSIASPRSWYNATLRLDTSEVRGHYLPISTRLSWPYLSNIQNKHLSFPLTQIGNSTTLDINIRNPVDTPLLLQFIVGDLYAAGHNVLGRLPVTLHPPLPDAKSADKKDFSLISISHDIEKYTGITPHKTSLSVLLKPGENYKLTVQFKPTSVNLVSNLLYIRNNLTVLEVLRLSGQGAVAQFKFGNRKPGSSTPLQFDILEKQGKDCMRMKGMRGKRYALFQPVKRSFTARNMGELPIYVSNFYINDLPCEGYGFKIVNCKPFLLTANSSRKIEIEFSTDFTLARVQRLLRISTSISEETVNYSLVATVPVSFLIYCGQVIPRPTWEALFFYSVIILMCFILLCVVFAGVVESDRMFKCSFISTMTEPTNKNNKSNVGTSTSTATGTAATTTATSNGHNHNHHHHHNNHHHQTYNNHKVHETKPLGTNLRTLDKRNNTSRSNSPTEQNEDKVHDHKTNNNNTSNVKSKKKLSKKQSNTMDDQVAQQSSSEPTPAVATTTTNNTNRKNNWNSLYVKPNNTAVTQTTTATTNNNNTSNKTNKVTNTNSEDINKLNEKVEKSNNNNKSKSNRKNRCSTPEPLIISEEDASSTTTEGSNNEDIEKEPILRNKTPVSHDVHHRDSYEGDGEEDDLEEPRTRRTKVNKQTKASLEQPIELPAVNQRNSSRSHNTESKSKLNKQTPLEKSVPRPTSQQKLRNKNQQDKQFYRARSETENSTDKSYRVPWDAPSSSQESTSDLGSPLSYSKIVSENTSDVIETEKKKESPGPIGPKLTPKRTAVTSAGWDFGTDRMSYATSSTPSSTALTSLAPVSSVATEPIHGLLNNLLVDSSWDHSVIHTLQEERRRRVEEHRLRQNLLTGLATSNWPRFDSWDNNSSSLYTASHNAYVKETPPPQPTTNNTSNDSFWDSSSTSTASQIWSNSGAWFQQQSQPEEEKKSETVTETPAPEFNLFGNVTHFWDAPTTSWSNRNPPSQL